MFPLVGFAQPEAADACDAASVGPVVAASFVENQAEIVFGRGRLTVRRVRVWARMLSAE